MPILFSRFPFPVCLLNRHRPTRNHSYWDGAHFASVCRDCGSTITRRSRGNWVRTQNRKDKNGESHNHGAMAAPVQDSVALN